MGTDFVKVSISNHNPVELKVTRNDNVHVSTKNNETVIDVKPIDIDEIKVDVVNHKSVSVGVPTNTTIIERVESEYETYRGKYEVQSNVNDVQVLPTKNKLMTKNVTILKIPYWETSNDFGTTCIIGKESELYGL